MDQQLQNQAGREIVVERINRSGRPEKMRFGFETEQDAKMDTICAGELKSAFIEGFRENEPTLENEPASDENSSFHLVGFDQNGAPTDFKDEDRIDLNTFSRFEISPRTTGGRVSFGTGWVAVASTGYSKAGCAQADTVQKGLLR